MREPPPRSGASGLRPRQAGPPWAEGQQRDENADVEDERADGVDLRAAETAAVTGTRTHLRDGHQQEQREEGDRENPTAEATPIADEPHTEQNLEDRVRAQQPGVGDERRPPPATILARPAAKRTRPTTAHTSVRAPEIVGNRVIATLGKLGAYSRRRSGLSIAMPADCQNSSWRNGL